MKCTISFHLADACARQPPTLEVCAPLLRQPPALFSAVHIPRPLTLALTPVAVEEVAHARGRVAIWSAATQQPRERVAARLLSAAATPSTRAGVMPAAAAAAATVRLPPPRAPAGHLR